MVSSDISASEKALIDRFHAAKREVGFDGEFGLPDLDRAILQVAEMASRMTVIRVLKALGINGEPARNLVFEQGKQETPLTKDALEAELRAILTFKD